MNRKTNQQYPPRGYAFPKPIQNSNSGKIKKDCGCNKGGYKR